MGRPRLTLWNWSPLLMMRIKTWILMSEGLPQLQSTPRPQPRKISIRVSMQRRSEPSMFQRYERIVGRSTTRICESQHDTRVSDAGRMLQITAAWSVSAVCKAKVGHNNALNVCTRCHAMYTIPERIPGHDCLSPDVSNPPED